MGRIIKLLFLLLLLGFAGLTGYAFLADLGPDQDLVTKPAVLDAN
ncbi:hypothetical protein [Gemmobacter denitrificans]|uniref:Uncharacterized protein n=1 Tax=Gemmobacter denitrificans TaxID=3123040 RepID=A0ABU8BQE6_9RHOB